MMNCSRLARLRVPLCAKGGRLPAARRTLQLHTQHARQAHGLPRSLPLPVAASLPLAMCLGGGSLIVQCDNDGPARTVPAHHLEPVLQGEPPVSLVQRVKQRVVDLWNKLCRFFMASKRIVICGSVISSALLLTPFAVYSNQKEFLWRYYLNSIQYLGPTFIKLAQWASTRPDLFP
jgi:hypothetical protein